MKHEMQKGHGIRPFGEGESLRNDVWERIFGIDIFSRMEKFLRNCWL